MTPDELLENAKKCRTLQDKVNTLNQKDCYLVISDQVFFRGKHGVFVHLDEDYTKLLTMLTDNIKEKVKKELEYKMFQLSDPENHP